jgi:hypothetical protein
MNDLGMSELHDKTKAFKIEPKSKDQVLVELRELKERLGLHQTSGDMNMTRSIIKRVGSLTELWSEMRTSERP